MQQIVPSYQVYSTLQFYTEKKRLHTTPHQAGQTFRQCLILVEMFAYFKTKTHKASISQTCKAKPLLAIHTNTKLGNLP